MTRARESHSPRFIRTKLEPPRIARKLVHRDTPLQALSSGATRALTVVNAPAGFGKTTLLTVWRTMLLDRGEAVAWLTLSRDDNDTNRFVRYLTQAVDGALRNLSHAVPEPPVAGTVESPTVQLTSLINDLDGAGREVTLILDDYDRITDPAVHDLTSFLLQHIPPNLHVVIVSRYQPPLPLSYLRASDQLVELSADKLRFGVDDTRTFFSSSTSIKLSASETRALHDATEGWVAGLQIAALVLGRPGNSSGLIAAFSGHSRALGEYLTENVLPQIAPDSLLFMLRTSILDSLTAGLCEHVAGCDDGQRLLDALTARNMFLQAIDDDGRWYRYHHLFADFLRAQLEHRCANEIPALHLRAAEWLSEHQLWADAVRHALAAGRVDIAVEWVERCAMNEVQDSRVQSVLAWVNKLPHDAVRQRPQLRLAAAWALLLTVRVPEVMAVVEDIERQLDAHAFPETREMRRELRALRFCALTIWDRTAAALDVSRQCLERFADRRVDADGDSWTDEAVLNSLIHCHQKSGDVETARSLTYLYRSSPDSTRNLLTMSYRASVHAGCEIREGHLFEAGSRLRNALVLCEERAGRRSVAASLLAGSLAGLHYEWDDLDTVEELLADRLDVIDDACYLEPVESAYVSLARLWTGRGECQMAHRLLDRAEIVADRRGWLRLLAVCAAERARLWWLENRATDADRALRRIDSLVATIREQGGTSEALTSLQLTRARNYLHANRFDAAVGILENAITGCEATASRRVAHQLRVLLAVALDGAGDRVAAESCLGEVLAFGETANITRSIVDEGPAITPLVDVLTSRRTATPPRSGYYNRLRAALGLRSPPQVAAGPGGAAAEPDVGELLSVREQRILELVAQDLTNKQIAKALLIAPETVKWHLKNVYTKLGVSTRAHAAHRARQVSHNPMMPTASRPTTLRDRPTAVQEPAGTVPSIYPTGQPGRIIQGPR